MDTITSHLLAWDVPRFLRAPIDNRRKKPRTTIVLLHGIGNSASAWNVLQGMLPADARIIAIDLLGFGMSPKPTHATYNVRVQARSIAATLIKLRLTTRIIIVGHSMGSLIATEIAKRYPLLVRGLILCAPPIYRSGDELIGSKISSEHVLRRLYNAAADNLLVRPEFYISLSDRLANTPVTSATFRITNDTVVPYVTALRASIMRQSAYKDLQKMKLPVRIIYGMLDPFVVTKNMKQLAKTNESITTTQIIAGHELKKSYAKPISQAVDAIIA